MSNYRSPTQECFFTGPCPPAWQLVHGVRTASIRVDRPAGQTSRICPEHLAGSAPTRTMFTPTRGAPYLVVFGGDQSGGSWRGHSLPRAECEQGLRRLNVLGLDLAWSDVDRGELREGYDVSISMSMSRSANLEKERGERGQSAGNKRLRAVRLRERAAARSRRPVRRVARVSRVRRRVIC